MERAGEQFGAGGDAEAETGAGAAISVEEPRLWIDHKTGRERKGWSVSAEHKVWVSVLFILIRLLLRCALVLLGIGIGIVARGPGPSELGDRVFKLL